MRFEILKSAIRNPHSAFRIPQWNVSALRNRAFPHSAIPLTRARTALIVSPERAAALLDDEYTIEFLKDGQLSYSFNQLVNGKVGRATVEGKWRQVKSFVQITIDHTYSVMQGKLDGGVIKGTLNNVEGLKRDFVLLKKSP